MFYLIPVALFSLPFSILISVEDDCMLQKFKARIDMKSNIICAGQKVYWKSIIGASERRALDNEFGSLWKSVDWERKRYCLKLFANCKYFGLIHKIDMFKLSGIINKSNLPDCQCCDTTSCLSALRDHQKLLEEMKEVPF